MPAATVTVAASSSTLMGKSAGIGFFFHSSGFLGFMILHRKELGREVVSGGGAH